MARASPRMTPKPRTSTQKAAAPTTRKPSENSWGAERPPRSPRDPLLILRSACHDPDELNNAAVVGARPATLPRIDPRDPCGFGSPLEPSQELTKKTEVAKTRPTLN